MPSAHPKAMCHVPSAAITLPDAAVRLACVTGRRVTEIEAERLEEARPDREAFLRQLRTDIERQSQERGVVVRFPDGSASTGGDPQHRA